MAKMKELSRLGRFIYDTDIVPRQLAEQAGISRQQLLRLRFRRAEARRPTMVKLARACGRLLGRKVRASELFDLGDSER